ncbi:ABC transporter substrate-binding protein [Xanthobacter dioxanivorans]|uniref:ABC transporter substrate-binding protein n=1 Tax=Xanthobacter dioxanivorans TaxID=2528964 RepID=A0A974SIP2_9HYPH|nr:ABC transporter substrate-binding protein [Xanthobacter dioxanivorans]QRG05558.1 ABC transporter substrate-binding protein [Xanthobacter dioxanivorans]
MNMSKSACLGALLLALAMPALANDADPIPLGVVQVLSGPQSKYGANANKGIELAAEEINKAGGINGRPIRLFTEDTAGSKDQAINAVRKVIGQNKVVLVIGPTLSTEVFAATPIANQRGVPSVALTATAPGIAAIGEFSFRASLPEDRLIPASLKRAKKLYDIKRAAILFANDDSNMKSSADIFKKEAAANGIEVVAVEAFSSRDSDFSAQLTKFAGLGVDSVLVGAYPDAGASILTQARRLGLSKVRFIGGNGFNSPKIIELAGPAAEGAMVSGPWSIAKEDEANRTFIAAYQAKYGEVPDQFGAQGYDGMKLVAQALKNAGATIDTGSIRTALQNVEFKGVMGPFRFDQNREAALSDGAVTFEVVNGAFKIVQ